MTAIYSVYGIRAKGAGALYAAPAVADMNAPSVAEFTAPGAFPIHCETENWSWQGEQNKTQLQRYCLAENVEAAGDVTLTAENIVVVYDPQDPTGTNYRVYAEMVQGTTWVLADRRGLLATTVPLAAVQYTDLIPVEVGYVSRVPITSEEGEKLRVTIPLILTSPPVKDVQFVA